MLNNAQLGVILFQTWLQSLKNSIKRASEKKKPEKPAMAVAGWPLSTHVWWQVGSPSRWLFFAKNWSFNFCLYNNIFTRYAATPNRKATGHESTLTAESRTIGHLWSTHAQGILSKFDWHTYSVEWKFQSLNWCCSGSDPWEFGYMYFLDILSACAIQGWPIILLSAVIEKK